MPVPIALVLGIVLVLAGLLMLAVAMAGARGRMARNRLAGIKTPATLSSQAAFTAAHRAAAVPLAVASIVAVVAGVVLLASGGTAISWVVLAVGLVGTAVLTGVGGLVGDRAAVALVNSGVADPAPAPQCAGSCAGCDLVAGCRSGSSPA